MLQRSENHIQEIVAKMFEMLRILLNKQLFGLLYC